MKRLIPLLLVLSLFCAAAAAEPLALLEDYTVDISMRYDEEDPSAGTFVYSCRYPHVDEAAEGAANINEF